MIHGRIPKEDDTIRISAEVIVTRVSLPYIEAETIGGEIFTIDINDWDVTSD